MSRIKNSVILCSIFLMPLLTDACPLCQAGATKRTQKAYQQTTFLLALLPLASGGGIFFWMRAKRKQMEADERRQLP